jgi:hypothetical protein
VIRHLGIIEDAALGDVITLPLRIGACATRRGLRVTKQTVGLVLSATADTSPSPPVAPRDVEAGVSPAQAPTAPPSTSAANTAEVPPTAETQAAPIPEFAPVHVSEQPEFVEAFAEPGAEEGAGAAVHVREPWKGYRQLTANEIIGRLADASTEELAGVALYEGRHRGRRTVLIAAERQLRCSTT